jgi:hypothetical protein
MKTTNPTDRKFLAAVEAEHAPGHDLLIEWQKRLTREQSTRALIVALVAALLAFALSEDDFETLFRYAAVAVFVIGYVIMRFVSRKHAKQVDADVAAFLEGRVV